MDGGRILGEGVDGCVFTAPSWPCQKGTTNVPNPRSSAIVSKIVRKDDIESEHLKVAARILGPELSATYLAGLQGECSPANLSHVPSEQNMPAFQADKDALLAAKDGMACGKLKKIFKEGKTLSETHKLMFISRYPMTVDEWITTSKKSSLVDDAIAAIPPFLAVLQKLVQNPYEQLVHIDLHIGNIFVRPLSPNGIQFGISDFGQCFSRQYMSDTSPLFFGKYLCEFVSKYSYFHGYSQVPLESRLLNYCYKKNLDYAPLPDIITGWIQDIDPKKWSLTDFIMRKPEELMKYLMKRPLFIIMLEQIQAICKKLRRSPDSAVTVTKSLTPLEKTVITYILTRYTVVSPINTITESVLNAINTTHTATKSQVLLNFLGKAILAPYNQDGSSLSSALTAVQGADLGILWGDSVSNL